MSYTVRDYAITGSYTGSDQVISKSIPVNAGLEPLVVDIKVSGGTATAKLQDSSDGFTTANDKKTVSISGAGTFSITLNPEVGTDHTHYPLRRNLRIALDSATACVIEEVRVCKLI